MAKNNTTPSNKSHKAAIPPKTADKKTPPSPPSAQSKDSSIGQNPWFWAALAAAFTLLLYLPALSNGFVNWDDGDYSYNQPLIRHLDAENLRRIWTEPIAANYHPLTMMSLAINYAVAGDSPFGYHLVNVLLHVLNVLLVFVFCYQLTRRKIYVSFAVALFFGIHPLHVESVAWVSERKDVLYTFFYIAALITYLRYINQGNRKELIYTFVLFLLSLFSKPAAVTLPLALLLLDYYAQKRHLQQTAVWVEKIPFLLLSLLFGWLTIKAQAPTAIAEFTNYTIPQKIMLASYGLVIYIVKLFLPFNLAALHPYPHLTANHALPPLYFLMLPVAVLLTAAAYHTTRFTRIVWFGYLFYLLNIVLVLQFVTVGKAIIAERYTYISYIGLLLPLTMGADYWINKKSLGKNIVWGLGGAAALICTILTYRQIGYWENGEKLWTQVIRQYPDCDVAYDNRGVYYRSLKKNDLAFADYNKVIQLNPKYALTYNNRGNIYFEQMKDDLALADYNQALALDSSNVESRVNRAVIHIRNSRLEQGFRDFTEAERLNKDFANLYLNRGIAYTMTSPPNHQAAVNDFTTFLRLKPNDDGIFNSRAVSYQQLGKQQEAIEDLSTAIKLNPKQGVFYLNRSYSYNAIGNKGYALQDAQKAQQLGIAVDPNYLNSLR